MGWAGLGLAGQGSARQGFFERVTDGVHRTTIYKRTMKPSQKVDVVEKDYKNEGEMLLDAMRLNSSHGKTLDVYDKTRCIIMAEKYKLPEMEIASALSMTVEKLQKLKLGRTGSKQTGKTKKAEPIALKRTIKHMKGTVLSREQAEVNEKLSGMNQPFYINQVIMLIESELMNMADEIVVERLSVLYRLLSRMPGLKKKAKIA